MELLPVKGGVGPFHHFPPRLLGSERKGCWLSTDKPGFDSQHREVSGEGLSKIQSSSGSRWVISTPILSPGIQRRKVIWPRPHSLEGRNQEENARLLSALMLFPVH